MGHDETYVLRTVEERGVRFVRLWFVDVLGLPKAFAVPAGELEAALDEGIGLDGSALEGFARARERDVIAHPDPRSFQVLPWRDEVVARMFCDIRLPDGAAFPVDRSELARETLGDRLCDWYVSNKRAEWEAYRTTVTEYERRRYLALL